MTYEAMWKRYKSINKKHQTYPSSVPNWPPECPVCHHKIMEGDEDVEYVKTKRGSEIWIHGKCVTEWGR